MSETTEAPPATEAPEPSTPAPEQQTPAPEQAPTEAPEGQEAAPEEPKKPKWVEPAINRLTREKHEARRRLEQIEKERDVYKALAEGRVGPDGATLPPSPEKFETDVQARARQMIEQQRTQERTKTLIDEGVKEFGRDEWDAKAGVIGSLGATENPAFMRAIVAVPAGQKIISALADDPDKTVALLAMDPVEMAAELGRMSAEIAAPKPRQMSKAPRPVEPIGGRATPEPNIYDTANMSMAEWVKLRNKQAPPHLGGVRKRG